MSHRAIRPMLELVVHGSTLPLVGNDVVVHRTRSLDPEDVCRVQGLPATTPERTIIDVASGLRPVQRMQLVDEALYRRWVDRERLIERAHLLQRGRPAACTVLLVASGKDDDRLRSALEAAALPLLREAGLTAVRMNVVPRHAPQAGGMDAVSERFRIIIELDGLQWHLGGKTRQRDNDKGNATTLGAYRLLRFTYADVMERPQMVIRAIQALVRSMAA